jgi:DNA-binding response OmpR family regulator
MKILLIDDDKLVLYTLSRLFRDTGDTVLTAENGAAGLALFRRERPDLVITDIVMPEQEGLATIIEMRRECPATKIIAISGGLRQRDYDVLAMASKLGADDIMGKPFEPQELLDRLIHLGLRKPSQPPAANEDEDPAHR